MPGYGISFHLSCETEIPLTSQALLKLACASSVQCENAGLQSSFLERPRMRSSASCVQLLGKAAHAFLLHLASLYLSAEASCGGAAAIL